MAFQPSHAGMTQDVQDVGMLKFYAEQSAMFAMNNPQNVQAQLQAQYWAERWNAAQRSFTMGQPQTGHFMQAAPAAPTLAPPGAPVQATPSFQPQAQSASDPVGVNSFHHALYNSISSYGGGV